MSAADPCPASGRAAACLYEHAIRLSNEINSGIMPTLPRCSAHPTTTAYFSLFYHRLSDNLAIPLHDIATPKSMIKKQLHPTLWTNPSKRTANHLTALLPLAPRVSSGQLKSHNTQTTETGWLAGWLAVFSVDATRSTDCVCALQSRLQWSEPLWGRSSGRGRRRGGRRGGGGGRGRGRRRHGRRRGSRQRERRGIG